MAYEWPYLHLRETWGGRIPWGVVMAHRKMEARMAKKRKGKKYKTAATMTIHGPGKMSAAGRKDIADWLRRNAALLMRGRLTDGRFRAGFHYG